MYESQNDAELALQTLRQARLEVHPVWLEPGSVMAGEKARGLARIGIPARRIGTYLRDLELGRFLVLAAGSIDAIGNACAVLGATNPLRLVAHAA